MKVKYIIILSFLSLFFLGCSKNKPATGTYAGFFHYESPQVMEKYSIIDITKSNKDIVIINGSTLTKDGKKISGMITNVDFGSFIEIEGEWSHKAFTDNYTIKGTFTQIQYQGGNQYSFSGTFEIKSN